MNTLSPAVTPAPSAAALQPFSVLLLYPDYATDNYGQETYLTAVMAADPEQALALARKEAVDSNTTSEGECTIDNPSDFFCLAVFEGHHHDVQPG
ncbi:MAG: hypothetical protein E6R08_10165 [Nevskiaceae bacterium]|nr:MAG: hypothetical protein E6R08_10165 [Nevskiaceae bacterium]